MKYRELSVKLRAAGFTPRQGKGDHEVWTHPAIRQHVLLTQTKEVSPGLTSKALKRIAEVEEANRKDSS